MTQFAPGFMAFFQRFSLHKNGLTKLVLVLSLGAGLAACDIQERFSHGYVPDQELIEAVRPGVHSRDQVARLLGSPSSIGTFEAQYWYYISRTVERVAMLEPEVIDQNVLVVEFDENDVVADLRQYTLEDGRIIDPVTQTTPTRGQELNLIQQLLGNIGRFTPE